MHMRVAIQLAGEYGLRNKREIWRIGLILSKIRRAARYATHHPIIIFECDRAIQLRPKR